MYKKPFALEAWWIIVPALISMAFTLYVFYPGYMSNDSVDQLTQGRENHYNAWHTPIMSWIWGRLDQVIPGPFGMLIFHNLLFWAGLVLFIHSVAPKWSGYLKSILILLTFLYRGWIYLLITFLLALYGYGYALFHHMKFPLPAFILALSTSGLLFGLAYFFISPACDFRYHDWVVISAILSLVATAYFKTHPIKDEHG